MKLGNRFTILTTNKHTQCFPNEEYKWKILLIINNMNIKLRIIYNYQIQYLSIYLVMILLESSVMKKVCSA